MLLMMSSKPMEKNVLPALLFSILLLPLLLFPSCSSAPEDVFHDDLTLVLVRQAVHLAVPTRPIAEMERIFNHAQTGPLQRAMNAQQRLYAAVLFTVFRERFQVKPPPATTTTVELRGKVVVVVVVVASIINDRSVLLTILITL